VNPNTSSISIEDIKAVLPKLTRDQIVALDRELHGYLETSMITRAAEGSFKEWQDPEEDIYFRTRSSKPSLCGPLRLGTNFTDKTD
jgi:hypothetical protein